MGAAQRRQRRGQRRAEETRARILEAAALHFAERGFEGTRLEDVGADVGIGRSAVLYHFKDKRQLYRAVLDALFGGLLEELRAVLSAGGSLAERIEAATRAFIDYVGRHPTAARIAVRESVARDPAIREEMQAQARPFFELLEMMFEEGERSGAFRPLRPDPLHFVSTVAGATLFYVAALPTFVAEMPFEPLAPDPLEAHKRDVLEVTRRLLGIRGPRSLPDRPVAPDRRDP